MEILLKLFCSKCIRNYRKKQEKIDSNRNINEQNKNEQGYLSEWHEYLIALDKKFELMDASDDKLSFDFDIVNILNGIDNFETFKSIYFDSPQYQIFNSLANKVVKEEKEDSYTNTKPPANSLYLHVCIQLYMHVGGRF